MVLYRDTGPVADGIYLIDTLIWGIEKQHAVYVIQSSEKTALIDTGVRRTLSKILKELEQLNIETIDCILTTHSHIDHSGALHQLAKQFPKAEICIPHLARDLIETYERKADRFKLSNPMRVLKEGSSIKLDAELVLHVLETPGHIPDHISFLDTKHQVLFVGDACGAHHLGSNFSRPTAYAPDFEHEKYLHSLHKFQEINPTGLAIASYGFATRQDAAKCISAAINDYKEWKDVVVNAIGKNPDASYVAEILLKKFGRSPGEKSENRPEVWVKGILRGIARGFINSLGLLEK